MDPHLRRDKQALENLLAEWQQIKCWDARYEELLDLSDGGLALSTIQNHQLFVLLPREYITHRLDSTW